MKNYLLFLLFFLVSLLGVKGIESALPSNEGLGVESVLQAEEPVGYILPVVAELPETGEAYVDVESMAGQYRVIGRGQRSFSVQQMLWDKSSAYRAAQRRLNMLSQTIHSVSSSLPSQSWAVPSDHYVFELRHILI
jgi:hypothetical protein